MAGRGFVVATLQHRHSRQGVHNSGQVSPASIRATVCAPPIFEQPPLFFVPAGIPTTPTTSTCDLEDIYIGGPSVPKLSPRGVEQVEPVGSVRGREVACCSTRQQRHRSRALACLTHTGQCESCRHQRREQQPRCCQRVQTRLPKLPASSIKPPPTHPKKNNGPCRVRLDCSTDPPLDGLAHRRNLVDAIEAREGRRRQGAQVPNV